MKLIFLHIPKAGGTTFHDVLERQYKKEEIYDILVVGKKSQQTVTTQNFIDLSKEDKYKINLLKGHMEFGLHTYFEGAEVRYITFFREPVKRIISYYNFIVNGPAHYLHDEVMEKKMSLENFVLSDLSDELDNHQVRLLSGKKNVAIGKCDTEMLELAKENLKKYFIAFGITERFDESLILFKNKLNWKNYPFYRKLNVTEGKKEIPEKLKEAIKERNKWDVQLYDWAAKEFEIQIAAIKDLQKEEEILKNASIGYSEGYSEGYTKGSEEGYNKGYNFVVNKFFFLRLGRKLKGGAKK